MTPQEQAAFDAMQEALEDLKLQYSEHPDAFWDWTKARAALSAAKEVSEHVTEL